MASTITRLESTPPVAEVLVRVKSVGASLKVKWTVEVLAATLTSWLSIVTATVGVTVSTVKLPVAPAVPALPLFSCQLVSTETSAVLMSVPAIRGEGWRCRYAGAVDHGQAGEHAAGCGCVGEGEIGRGFAEGEVDRGGAGGDVDVVAVDGHGRGRGDGIDGEAAGVGCGCRRCRHCPSCQLLSTETSAVLMSVPALAVKVAV